VGGALLLAATAAALVWANSPWSSGYVALRDQRVGADFLGLHLNLTLGTWATDGLLAIFFFVAGLELKREFVAGDLRDPTRAALPIAAAVGGMVLPAAVFVAITAHAGEGATRGWPIPIATDAAFAVAVLAVISTHLPAALRTFLLTLAVVDDLLAITVIAVFYTEEIRLRAALAAAVPATIFALCARRRLRSSWVLIPLAVLTWAFVHESGVHATVSGVLLSFTVPVRSRHAGSGPEGDLCLAERLEHHLRPISATFAVPLFAFFSAGVTFGGYHRLLDILSEPITVATVLGLVVGKPAGVFATAGLLAAGTRATLDAGLRWIDVFGIALLAGIGFTVSLLMGDLAYHPNSGRDDLVKVGVLTGSLAAAILAATVLRLRNRHYRGLSSA
jgi:Na+:H+ antiporter, NhaA family